MVRVRNVKVAFVHPDLGIGGAERLILDVALALKRHGVQVSFITNHFDPNHAFDELKAGTFPVTVYGDWLIRSIFGLCQAFCAYIRMFYLSLTYTFFCLDNNRPDIYIVDQIPIAVPVLKFRGYKVIYYCHHPDLLASGPGGWLKKLYRYPLDIVEEWGTNKADVILANSKYTAHVFMETFPSITKELQILYPTVTPGFVDLLRKEAKTGPPKSVPNALYGKQRDRNCIFLSINRFHPAKNLTLALSAMRSLKLKVGNAWDHVYLIIAGGCDPESKINNDYFVELQKYVKDKGLGDKVIFVKSPSDSEKARLLLNCDCLIYTPVKEHFGIVPLEAMMAYKPVIAVDDGGPRETVKNGVTGYLCRPNAVSMADYMKLIVDDKDKAKQMGRFGRKHCEEFFSYETFSEEITEVVEEIILESRNERAREANQARRGRNKRN